jgi:hypothetical protein
MNINVRFTIFSDAESKEVLILDTKTGTFQRPVCWQDLLAYYNYLVGTGRIDESQKLLAESMEGKKPITKMLEFLAGTPYVTKYYR